MIKVFVTQRGDQPDCWYINKVSGIGVTPGKIGYQSSKDAATIARRQHPNADIRVEK